MTKEDHDTLIDIRNDVRHLLVDYAETKKKVDRHDKVFYGGMGILFLIEILTKLWR